MLVGRAMRECMREGKSERAKRVAAEYDGESSTRKSNKVDL